MDRLHRVLHFYPDPTEPAVSGDNGQIRRWEALKLQLEAGPVSVVQLSANLRISERQVQRLIELYKEIGDPRKELVCYWHKGWLLRRRRSKGGAPA